MVYVLPNFIMKILGLFFAVMLFCIGCGDNYIANETKTIPAYGWTYRDSLAYHFDISDTTKLYNLYLDIKHDDTYPLQNLYTFIKTDYPNGKQYKQQLNIDLASKSGNWNGKKSWFGNEYNTRIVLQEGAFFNQIGTYKLGLQQYLRQDSLQGLKSLTFCVENTNQVHTGAKKKK